MRRPQPRDESRFGLCPLSLAATYGINVFFFSCGYLDVSVPHVRSIRPMNSAASDWKLLQPSFLIRKSPDRRLFASFPEHFAGYHVLRRLSMPRHPPCTLSSLTTFIDHRHDSPREELTPRRVSSGRAGNGTDNRQRSYRRKGARRSPPDRKTKMGGNREVFVSCPQEWLPADTNKPLNLVIHLSKSKVRIRVNNPRRKLPSNTGETAASNLLTCPDSAMIQRR